MRETAHLLSWLTSSLEKGTVLNCSYTLGGLQNFSSFSYTKDVKGEFPGSPVVRTPHFPGRGTKVLPAVRRGQKKKKKKERWEGLQPHFPNGLYFNILLENQLFGTENTFPIGKHII